MPEKAGEPTLRAQLELVERQSGHRDELLDAERIPQGFEYLYRMFWEVRSGSSEGMGGVSLTWRDLADYQTVTGIALDAFEVEALMAMDAALGAAREERNG